MWATTCTCRPGARHGCAPRALPWWGWELPAVPPRGTVTYGVATDIRRRGGGDRRALSPGGAARACGPPGVHRVIAVVVAVASSTGAVRMSRLVSRCCQRRCRRRRRVVARSRVDVEARSTLMPAQVRLICRPAVVLSRVDVEARAMQWHAAQRLAVLLSRLSLGRPAGCSASLVWSRVASRPASLIRQPSNRCPFACFLPPRTLRSCQSSVCSASSHGRRRRCPDVLGLPA